MTRWNNTGTSKVGTISKAQKAQFLRLLEEKKCQFSPDTKVFATKNSIDHLLIDMLWILFDRVS